MSHSHLAARIAALVLAVLAIAPRSAHGADRFGSISGRVTDHEGRPIADANIVLPEMRVGTRTDAEGKYRLLHVPAGSWTLRALIAGKKPADRPVTVEANRTAAVDFALVDAPYRIDGITVIGNPATAIRTKETTTKTYISDKQIRESPFLGLKENISLTAGVTTMENEIHFRAGRGDEILTMVNGVPSTDPLQAQGVELGLLAVSSSEQVLGGMDAQYGKALSGVIALTTKEGGDRFGGEARYFTDRYGEADKSFTNFERVSMGFGGPFLAPGTTYFVSLQGTYTDTYLPSVATHREHRFLDFIRIGNRQANDVNLSSKVAWRPTPNEKLTAEVIRNASLHTRFHNRWNRVGYVQVHPDSTAPTDGTVTQRYGTWAWYPVDSTYVPMNTANHLPVLDEDYQQLALAWKQVLAGSAIYNIRLSRQTWSSTEDVLDRQPWEYQQRPNQYYDAANRDDGAYYVTNGDYPFYERRRSAVATLNADVTKDFRRHHFMAGGEIDYNDLNYLLTQFPNVLDPNGNYGATRDEFRSFNPEGSFFAQDRWQYEGMVLNAGVRYDAFSVGDQIPTDQVAHRVKTQWSPRIGIAHPISDRDVMSFHYGRYFQIPDRLHIFQGRTLSAEARGNPNLEPETDIAYQLGVQHQFSSILYTQVSVYFKDIFGLLTTVDQEVPGFSDTRPTYVNGDYASARGIEVTLIKQRNHGFSGEVNYTYGNASGTASDPNRALASRGNLRDQYKPNREQPLRWDQRHNVSATLRIGNEKNWAASFIYQFGTGFPYTPLERTQRRQDPNLINSRRLPSVTTLSAQAERFFDIWGQRVTFYVQATNLLDAKNISVLQPDLGPTAQVDANSYIIYYTETGRAGGAFLTADRTGDGRDDWYPVNDPRVFQQGRVIRTGIGVQF
jgi:outer membrane receptor for ferrienterochelin and colicin